MNQYQITEYSPTVAALAELEQRHKGAVFDLSSTSGMSAARKARAEIRTYRTSLEAMRKAIKAPALERCRLIDAEAKAITERLVSLETPIDDQIKAEEARIEAEKEAKRQAEAARVAAITDRINAIKLTPASIPRNATSDEIAATADKLDIDGIVDAEYQEFAEDAAMALDATVAALRAMAADRKREEAAAAEAQAKAAEEAAKLAEARAEIERQQAALAAERAAAEAKLAVERAEAEEKLAAEHAENERLADIERQRVAAERAALEAERAKLSAEQAEKERAARAKHEHAEIVETLSPIAEDIAEGRSSLIDGLVQAYRMGAQA
jgi:colicin import membrane protein